MKLNQVGSPKSHRLLQEGVIDPIRALNSGPVNELRGVLQSLTGDRLRSVDGNAEAARRLHGGVVTRMKTILEQMSQWESFVDVVNQVAEVIKMQQNVSQGHRESPGVAHAGGVRWKAIAAVVAWEPPALIVLLDRRDDALSWPDRRTAQAMPKAADKAAGVFDDATKTRSAAGGRQGVPAVSDRDTIGFTQENVAAQMTELEERMFRLSEALRGLEPENASRLRLALKFSREEQILDQMRETHKLLKDAQISKAETEVRELLAKLEHLRNLLLAEDLDFQLKFARLRQMRETARPARSDRQGRAARAGLVAVRDGAAQESGAAGGPPA